MDEFDNSHSSALTTSVLSSPAQVTEQLTGPDPRPVVHIPLPGWVWDLERRRQWREALEHWATIDNLVILVELPPASVPEAVLLGSNLPNVLWLASNRQARAHHTREQLQTLRDARCNIVGAGFNREFHRSLRSKFPRWLAAMAIGCSFLTFSGFGQDSTATASDAARESRTNGSFSITRPAQRGAWQQRLTLGPGDVLTFNLFGQPELVRTEVAVAPDGRISFLEAQDVVASGLTVDELRAKVDDELGKFRRAPRSMITPVAFKSKRYYILGKVVTKGVYTLDRPITVLEAIARAHGLENGLVDRNLVDLADFQKSFLLRSGKRLNLDFEQLFQAGDLSQNVAMEPDDYLYVASSDVNEVYVVGEVRLPGAVTYRPDMNIIGAISSRGGYTDRAFKKRVVVVRGSLEKPETIVVDTHAILDAKQTNFKLKPRDIIYVNSRPFILVEEVLDMAATAFIQSLITEWVGVDVVKPIN